MQRSSEPERSPDDFYGSAADLLTEAKIPFLVSGAFALQAYTGVSRNTKDFDLTLMPSDVDRALDLFTKAGYRAGYTFRHWLAKVHFGEHFIDIIFRGGNGLCEVDRAWFAPGRRIEVFGRSMEICPAEEMIWQKCYIMERERFDGADVLHLIRNCGREMDWKRLVARFGPDWRVLLSHLVLFGFVYPTHRDAIADWVIPSLVDKLNEEELHPPAVNPEEPPLCQGTLLSRAQYLADVERWGYKDARLDGRSRMTPEELREWTNAIDRDQRPR